MCRRLRSVFPLVHIHPLTQFYFFRHHVPLHTGLRAKSTEGNALEVTLADCASLWSAPFSVDQINDVYLRVGYSDGRTPLYLGRGGAGMGSSGSSPIPTTSSHHHHRPYPLSPYYVMTDGEGVPAVEGRDPHEGVVSSFCVIRASVFQKDNGVTFVTFDRSEVEKLSCLCSLACEDSGLWGALFFVLFHF